MIEANNDGYPILPHLASEFLLWLWYSSEQNGNCFEFEQPEEGEAVELGAVASVDLWVDERIAMRPPDDARVTAVLTGENPAASLESRAAIVGGKVLQEMRIGLRADDREYFTTLKAPDLILHGTSLPRSFQEDDGGDAFASLVFDRMSMLEELDRLIAKLFREFAKVRVSSEWRQIASNMNAWISGEDELSDEL